MAISSVAFQQYNNKVMLQAYANSCMYNYILKVKSRLELFVAQDVQRSLLTVVGVGSSSDVSSAVGQRRSVASSVGAVAAVGQRYVVSGAVGHRSSSVGGYGRDDSGVGEGQAEGEDHELEHGDCG